MKFEFRKWGEGTSCYSVALATEYNPIVKRYNYVSIGVVQKDKDSRKWVGMGDSRNVVGDSRQEVAEKLVELHLGGNDNG